MVPGEGPAGRPAPHPSHPLRRGPFRRGRARSSRALRVLPGSGRARRGPGPRPDRSLGLRGRCPFVDRRSRGRPLPRFPSGPAGCRRGRSSWGTVRFRPRTDGPRPSRRRGARVRPIDRSRPVAGEGARPPSSAAPPGGPVAAGPPDLRVQVDGGNVPRAAARRLTPEEGRRKRAPSFSTRGLDAGSALGRGEDPVLTPDRTGSTVVEPPAGGDKRTSGRRGIAVRRTSRSSRGAGERF